MIMLIEQAEKKEDSSSKRYEISKWSFGDDILMTDSIEILCLYCHIVKVLYSIEILDDPQKNDELNTFSNFFNQEPIYNLTLEVYAILPCVCFFSALK